MGLEFPKGWGGGGVQEDQKFIEKYIVFVYECMYTCMYECECMYEA